MHPLKIALLHILSVFILATSLVARAQTPPNIVMILVDDLGWRDLACYGSELYETPSVDALAASGLSFSNGYAASPLCTPTRASILTGQTPARLRLTTPVGHQPVPNLEPQEQMTAAPGMPMTNPETANRIPLDSVTISKLLQDSGYKTAFMGKWHLGFDPYIPENFGFDHVVGGRGFPGPPPPGFFGPWDTELTNMPEVTGQPNADDVIGDEAVRFIESNEEAPFFLALWFFNVHAPFQGKPELVEKYRSLAEGNLYQKSAIMGAMVETMDQNVGKVTDVLERLGLDENTLIIFTSDNGGNMYDRPEGVNPTSNYPLKAGKGNNYEGGSRVPFILKWPGKVPAGKWTDTIVTSYDLFPTLLDVVGIERPSEAVLDGVSLMPAFDGHSMERPPIVSMFGHTVLATGSISNVWIRDGKWKLLRFFNTGLNQADHFELYDLSEDIGESNNLALDFPEKLEQLQASLADYLEESGTLLPRLNPKYDPEATQARCTIQNGGYFVGAPSAEKVTITSNDDRVTLNYTPAKGESGTHLQFSIVSNCARSVLAGAGVEPIWSLPIPVISDLQPRVVQVPIGRDIDSGPVSIVFDMEQPGRTHLEALQLVTP